MSALPLVAVQHDWIVDVEAKAGTFWVSSRLKGEPSVEGSVTVRAESGSDDLVLEASPGFEATLVAHGRAFRLGTPHGVTVTFHAPEHHRRVHDQPLRCLHATSTGASVVVGGHDGLVQVLSLETRGATTDPAETLAPPQFHGHLGDVTCARFFPSDQVLLTGSADTRIKIWSAATGESPVTLSAHSRRVSALQIVGRGRNVLSCAWDGTVRLHDCGTAQSIATVVDHAGTRWSAMDAVPAGPDAPCASPAPFHEREVGTEGVALICVSDTGDAVVADVRSRSIAQHLPRHPAALLACAALSSHLVAVGSDAGEMLLFDLRRCAAPLCVLTRGSSGAALTALCGDGPAHVVAAFADGSCLRYNVESALAGTVNAWDELSGPDLLPLFAVSRVGAGERAGLATAGDDGVVRFYNSAAF